MCGRTAIYECDTTIKGDTLDFTTCGSKMCKAHIGSNPQDNYHRCTTCSRIRGDEGYFVNDKPETVLPLPIEQDDPF